VRCDRQARGSGTLGFCLLPERHAGQQVVLADDLVEERRADVHQDDGIHRQRQVVMPDTRRELVEPAGETPFARGDHPEQVGLDRHAQSAQAHAEGAQIQQPVGYDADRIEEPIANAGRRR
jgi:hypothetical protein